MKAFRIRDVGDVEPHIAWIRMDGTAFVLVGGASRPYLTVSPDLAPEHEKSGQVVECDFRLDKATGGMELIPVQPKGPQDQSLDEWAIVIVPAGGFDFRAAPGEQLPLVPRQQNCARVVVLAPGEQIRAFPYVRTLAEQEATRPLVLRFDGREVTFAPVE